MRREDSDLMISKAPEYRVLRCPRCGRRLIDVAAGSTGKIRIKCRNCKFEGELVLGRFRHRGRPRIRVYIR